MSATTYKRDDCACIIERVSENIERVIKMCACCAKDKGARMSDAQPGALVRLPSGRLVGAEVNDRGNLVPHKWSCVCARCDPIAEAKRQRVRDAAPDLLEALQLLTNGFKYPAEVCQIARAAIAKAVA